ncbi:MAG: hypothetical protein JO194_03575 [Candidatus Eremiobacteraeota bacterium]|nr:hypothetical protein [Candidatus Eremiobacteraeota bacterium]
MHDDDTQHMDTALMLDGNAAAGELEAIFGRDMTMAVARCYECAADTMIGALMAFTRGPGAVLCCPHCHTSVMRIVETPNGYYVDVRGAAYMRFARL